MNQEQMQTPEKKEDINYIVKLNNKTYIGKSVDEGSLITANIKNARLFISDIEAMGFAEVTDGVVYEVKETLEYKRLDDMDAKLVDFKNYMVRNENKHGLR